MAHPTDGRPEPGPDADIGELKADIASTREELSATVSALVDKSNVTARVQDAVADTKQAAVERAHQVQDTVRRNPGVDAGVVVAVVAAVLALVWVRRRRR